MDYDNNQHIVYCIYIYYIYIYISLAGGAITIMKNMKVSWDDDIPNIQENKIHVPNHQPDKIAWGFL